MSDSRSLEIVVVGGVAGGASAATRARRLNEAASITIYEKDEYVSFANCGLPYFIGGEIPARDSLLLVSPELLRRRFRIDVNVRHEVTSIDRSRRTVTVLDRDAGRSFEKTYDKLILAPGASPIVPPIPGTSAENVFCLRNVPDADRIKAWLDDPGSRQPYVEGAAPRHAVVVGAGYIGLEMVEQLVGLGVDVTLVELQDQVLPLLDPEMARSLQEELTRRGVRVLVGDSVAAIDDEGGRARSVRLGSGRELPVDVVILGVGVRPNVHLAQSAGLEIGEDGGIRVSDTLQTSDPDVYAVGDAVEYVFGPTGESRRIPLAGPANRAGRIAGEHAATGRTATRLAPVLGTSAVRVFSLTAGMTGLSLSAARRAGKSAEAVTVRALHHVGYYPGAQPMNLKLVYDPDDGRVLGAQAVGGEAVDKRLDVIATAIQLGGTVRDLAGLDLSYAPPFGAAKDPVHMAAFAACNALDGVVTLRQPGDDLDGVQLVDVRTPAEVESMPCPGATPIPLDELRDRIGELDPERPTVVTCLSGQRSYIASRILSQSGFASVANLTGGATMRRLARPDEFAAPAG